jgi:hypothetical protein
MDLTTWHTKFELLVPLWRNQRFGFCFSNQKFKKKNFWFRLKPYRDTTKNWFVWKAKA